MSREPALRLELRASPALTLLTLTVHAAAAATVLVWLPWIEGLCAASLLVALGALAIRQRTLLWTARAAAGLGLGREGSLLLRLRSGHEFSAVPAGRRYVSRWLVVLDLDTKSDGRRTLLVARDMLGADEFRLLRLWALWNTLPAARAPI